MSAASHALRFGTGEGVCAVDGGALAAVTAAARNDGESVHRLLADDLTALQALHPPREPLLRRDRPTRAGLG